MFNIPFTSEQFYEVFQAYNLNVWPMQIVLNAMAVLIVFLILKRYAISSRTISGLTGLLWIWCGLVYHIGYFSHVNRAAYGFGILFILQGGLFFLLGFWKKKLIFHFEKNRYGLLGSLFVLYALILYPVIGLMGEHAYPSSPTFGVPCPLTIFTFGILLWTMAPIPFVLLIIPLLWSFIGFNAVLHFGVWQDVGLLLSGLIATYILLMRDKKYRMNQATHTD